MHHRRRFVVLLLALAMLLPAIAPGAAARQPGDRQYVSHMARFTATIPADWSLDPDNVTRYLGTGGYLTAFPVIAATLEEACPHVGADMSDSRRRIETIEWRGQPACRYQSSVPGDDAAGLVVPHPYPFQRYGETYGWVVIVADTAHFDAIVESISFEPEDLTPEAYILSALEIAETHAYFSNEVDWEAVRQQVLERTPGMDDEEMRHSAINTIIQALAASGDNHSGVSSTEAVEARATESGTGATMIGRRVVLISPDSPADRAGIQPGDEIIAMDGRPLPAVNWINDLILPAGKTTIVTVRHADGTTEDVSLEPGPYVNYAPPYGRVLEDRYGYVLVPDLLTPGVDADFAAAGQSAIREADRQGACGWIVDLRLNTGGSYPPMVTAIGPILGNGPFYGRVDAHGEQSFVTYDAGEIRTDSGRISELLGDASYTSSNPDAPVAVLTGSITASAGEVTTLAFIGRPHARSFGDRTAGYTTGVSTFHLFDGMAMALATGAMTDRTGKTHLDGIEPDENVPVDWTRFGTDEDPAIVAATEWLAEQPACARATPVASPAA